MRRAVGIGRWDFGFGLRRSATIVGAVLIIGGLGSVAHAGPAPAAVTLSSSFGVEFTDCSELASITTITVAKARTVVPASFTLAVDTGGGTPFVVRVAHCRAVSVDGNAPEAGTVAQLGVSIVSPDGTGDINNYTAWYYTTSLRFAVKLQLLGVPHSGRRDSATTSCRTPRRPAPCASTWPAGHPAFRVTAPVVEPVAAAVPFQANWWIQSGTQRTRMSTPIPALRFGTAAATLTTPRVSQLGQASRSVHRHVRLARLVQPIRPGAHDGEPLIVPQASRTERNADRQSPGQLTCEITAARPASSRATGTRKGEQDT